MANWRRVFVLVVAALVTWLIAMNTGRRLPLQMAYVLTALFWAAFFVAWSGVRGIVLARVTPSRRSQVGHIVEEHLAITNRWWLPKLWVEVRDFSTLPGHRVSHVVPALRGRRTYRWHVRTLAIRRGVFRLGPMRLGSGDPFGLFFFRRDIPQHTSIIVYPYIAPLSYFPLPEGRLAGGEIAHRRTHQVTTNVSGVREYMPGDSLSRIHWRTTARARRLMSKEFELDPLADVWLVLDMHRDVYAGTRVADESLPPVLALERPDIVLPPHAAEYAIAVAATLGNYMLRQDRALGVVSHARRRWVLPADRGERQRERMLEMLAVVEPEGVIPLKHLLLAELPLFGRYTTLLIVTGDWTARWVPPLAELKRRGVVPIVILVDGSTFADMPGPDAALTNLARQNVLTFVVRNGDSLTQALTHPVIRGT